MKFRFAHLPRPVLVSVVLNALTLVIYVFGREQFGKNFYFSARNLFAGSIILTVLALFFINIVDCIKTAKGFYSKKQYYLLVGQILIAFLLTVVAGRIVHFLAANFMSV